MQIASSTDIQHREDGRRRPRSIHFADTFTFRLPVNVSEAIRANADGAGKTKSEWLRAVILREVGAAGHEVAS